MSAWGRPRTPGTRRALLAVWSVLLATGVPALYLTGTRGDAPTGSALLQALLFIAGSYLPWMAGTPWLLRLCERLPLGLGRTVRNAALLLALGAVLVPLLSTGGWWLGRLLAGMAGGEAMPAPAPGRWRVSVAATSLFAAPLYLALVGVGQTLAQARRHRRRGELLAQARQQALRGQLQQHFLFNALNAIGSLGYHDPARADQALAQLSQLLRSLLECPDVHPLREELAAATAFVDLHRLLLGDDLALHLEVDAEAWHAQVPAMLLQPLVENAVRHGSCDAGALQLSARVEHGGLVLRLRNATAGVRTTQAGSGIGLDNLRQRLSALHGNAARLRTVAGADRFEVEVRLPLRQPPAGAGIDA